MRRPSRPTGYVYYFTIIHLALAHVRTPMVGVPAIVKSLLKKGGGRGAGARGRRITLPDARKDCERQRPHEIDANCAMTDRPAGDRDDRVDSRLSKLPADDRARGSSAHED